MILREKEDNKLKELNALVGKKKEIINKEKKQHKKRVGDALKQSAADVKTAKDSALIPENVVQLTEEEKLQEEEKARKELLQAARKKHNPQLVKERLREKLRANESTVDPLKKIQSDNKLQIKSDVITELKQADETKNKLDENIKKLNDILKKAKQTSEQK